MQSRRKTIVINKEFQHHYALMAVVMTVLLINLFIIIRMLLPGGDPIDFSPGTALLVAGIEIAVMAAVWYGSLKVSHKVAGPVFVFTRQVKAVGAGDLTARVKLRTKDMFQEEAAEINVALDQLQAKIDSVKGITSELQQAQQAGQDAGTHVDRLVAELESLRTAEED